MADDSEIERERKREMREDEGMRKYLGVNEKERNRKRGLYLQRSPDSKKFVCV